ncbi:LexA repressor [Brachybacterium faecium]|nr:LexA repressor [Brachybacterium faecium]
MTIGERMKLRRNELKISADLVAEKLGVSRSTIFRYEKGEIEKLPTNILSSIAEILKTTPSYLMGWEEQHPTASPQMIDLPLYGDVAAGALAEMESVDVWDVENIQLPIQLFPSLSSYTNLFAMRVNGDSMDKVIPDNSLVVVKACEDYVYKDGDIVVFSYNGEYSLKRYRPNAMKGFILFEADSHNPDFQDIPINKENMPEARIYGKVIFYGVTPTN